MMMWQREMKDNAHDETAQQFCELRTDAAVCLV